MLFHKTCVRGRRTSSQSADDSCTGNGSVDDGNDILQFCLEDRVKVGGRCERRQAVSVGMLSISLCQGYGRLAGASTYELVSLAKTPMSEEFSN